MSEIKVVRPDILDCLANLSSDEVFTPPAVVNKMLDLLPQKLFRSPKTRFLDPFTKSGVFLREIVKRLDKGLEDVIPDKEERIRHIFANQVYGIAITQLTALFSRRSLYCNKDVNNVRSTIRNCFRTEGGNIGYHPCRHMWVDGSCKICGASKKALSQSPDVENYAYPFLHDEVFMKQAQELGFDVVIGNPPYQLKDGGNNASAVPIYQKFVQQAKRLNPKYLCMIIPARWYSGGRGLDDFRDTMLNDRHLVRIVDYPNADDCFPGVDIAGGVCYFLRDRSRETDCEVTTMTEGVPVTVTRQLNEFPTFVRYAEALNIINKVKRVEKLFMETMVSSQKPFGLRTYVVPTERGDIKLRYSGGVGPFKRGQVTAGQVWIDKYKIIMSYLTYDHAGKPDKDGRRRVFSTIDLLPPGTVCTETYIVVGAFATKREAENLWSYLRTRFVRFLVAQMTSTQHISKGSFAFVPMQDFSKPWTDAELYKKYKLTKEEISFIESMIRPMDAEEKK